MKFTLKQLYSIIDGRVSCTDDEIFAMLNHITGESLSTTALPTAMAYIKSLGLPWYVLLAAEIDSINLIADGDFKKAMELIEGMNYDYEIPALTDEQKEGFEAYMVENSLLKR